MFVCVQARDKLHLTMSKCFDTVPATGTLSAGESTHVQVRFIPTFEDDISTKLKFEIADNTEPAVLSLSGTGYEAPIELVTPTALLDATLPHVPAPLQHIRLTNNDSKPVEVYCREYDSQWPGEHAALLKLADCFDPQRRLLLPPRDAGALLPADIRSLCADRMDLSELSADDHAHADGGAAVRTKRDTLSSRRSTSASTRPLSREREQDVTAADPADPGVDADEDTAHVSPAAVLDGVLKQYLGGEAYLRELRGDHGGINCLVYGTASADTHGVAAALADRFHAALLNVDSVVQAAIKQQTDAGLRALNYIREQEAMNESPLPGAGSEDGPSTGNNNNGGGLRVGGEDKHKEGERDVKLRKLSKVQSQEADNDAVQPVHLPDDILSQILSQGVRDYPQGVVFSGCETRFSTLAGAAAAIFSALSKRDVVFSVCVSGTAHSCCERLLEAAVEARNSSINAAVELEEVHPPEELDEDDYEQLSEEEQRTYDFQLQSYRAYMLQKTKQEETDKQRLLEEDDKQRKRSRSRSGKKGGKKSAENEDDDIDVSAFEAQVAASLLNVDVVSKLVMSWDRAAARPGQEFVDTFGAPGQVTTSVPSKKTRRHSTMPGEGKASPQPATSEQVDSAEADVITQLDCPLDVSVDDIEERMVSAGLPSAAHVAQLLGFGQQDEESAKSHDFTVVSMDDLKNGPPHVAPEFYFVDLQEYTLRCLHHAHLSAELMEDHDGSLKKKKRVAGKESRMASAAGKRPQSSRRKPPGSARGQRKDDAHEIETEPVSCDFVLDSSRWIIPPHSSIQIAVGFKSVRSHPRGLMTCLS